MLFEGVTVVVMNGTLRLSSRTQFLTVCPYERSSISIHTKDKFVHSFV